MQCHGLGISRVTLKSCYLLPESGCDKPVEKMVMNVWYIWEVQPVWKRSDCNSCFSDGLEGENNTAIIPIEECICVHRNAVLELAGTEGFCIFTRLHFSAFCISTFFVLCNPLNINCLVLFFAICGKVVRILQEYWWKDGNLGSNAVQGGSHWTVHHFSCLSKLSLKITHDGDSTNFWSNVLFCPCV